MNAKTFIKKRWKLLLNLLTLAAFVVLIYVIRHDLADTFDNFSRVNVYLLLLAIPLEALGYHAQTRMYQSMFQVLGTKLDYKRMLRMSLEINFVNHVFPSGGVTGISYFSLRMKGQGVKGAQAALVQSMKVILGFLSFEILLVAGMFLLALHGRASNLTIFTGTILAFGLLVGTGLLGYIVGSKTRINKFFVIVPKVLNRLIHIVRPRRPETIKIDKVRGAFDEFHDSYVQLRSKRSDLKAPFWWAFVINVSEVLIIYFVFIAFGEWVNIGAIIIAYAVANFAGLVSIFPGGAGIYEGLMISVLATAGVSPALTLPVVIMYRVVNTIIQIPPGYYLYSRALRQKDNEPSTGAA